MIQALPCEIVTGIAEWLSPTDLRSLRQVCSKLYCDLLPLYYRVINFHASNEWALNALNSDSYFRTHKQSMDNFHLIFTRDLAFSAPFEIARFNRCVYYDPSPSSSWFKQYRILGPSNETKAHAGFLDDISRQVDQIVRCLADHRLQSFSWHLGICIPPGLFDVNGLFITRQRNLESISLITDGSCPYAGAAVDQLSRLSRLKSLSWEGIQHPSEFQSLERCIQNNSNLVKLSVGFALSSTNFNVINSMFQVVPSTSQYNEKSETNSVNYFPELVRLRLSKAVLPRHVDSGIAFNIGMLRSLSLLNCMNDLSFLRSLSHMRGKIQIQHFEFCGDMLQHESLDFKGHPLTEFLKSFNGLRHLQLKLSNFRSEPHLEIAIAHHRSSLNTLVYHERNLQSIDAEGQFQETRDKQLTWLVQLPHILPVDRLSALAVCASPSDLRSVLEPVRKMVSFRTLHLRWSGSERIHRNVRQSLMSRLTSTSSRHRCNCKLKDISNQSKQSHRHDDLDLRDDSLPQISSTAANLSDYSEEDEYLQFAEWAFGPTGIPNLETLAMGDFSFGSRYQNQQFLLRRRSEEVEGVQHQNKLLDFGITSNFFFVGTLDDHLFCKTLMIENSNFLCACPDGNLMDSPYE